MPINFPSSPTSGSQYTYGSKTWQWNGYAWDIVTPTTISTFNGCTSSAITITGTANEITVDTTCPNIVIGLPNNLVVQNLTVTGSLLVSGGITTQMSEVVLIEDNFVTLNANVTAGAPTENAGIIISRGASANVDLRWNETSDNWQFTNNGTDYWNLPINVVNTFNGLTGAVSFDVPVASASVTGVASFGNQFVVSAAGAVSLTSNYVKSINGSTGAITNVAKTNIDNGFTLRQSISDNLATNQVTVGGSTIDFYYGVSENIQVLQSADVTSIVALPGDTGVLALTKDVVASLNGITGARTLTGDGSSIRKWATGSTEVITARNASLSLTGVASFSNADFVVGSTGHVGLTGTVARKNSDNSFSTIQTFGAGISASGGLTALGDYFIGSGSGAIRGLPASNYIVIGDENGSNNGTQILIDDSISVISVKSTIGYIYIGDVDAINTGNVIEINPPGGLISMFFPEVYTNGYMNAYEGYRIGSGAINAQTGTSYTLTGTDNGKIVTFNNGSAVTVTVPAGLVQGYNCTVIQLGGGQVGFTAPAGVTLNSYGNQFKMIGQHGSATVLSYLSNVYNLSGNLIV